jgi:SPX domain protein involved in polyphosphate accumulation
MGMIRVEGHKDLYRDEESGAIVNCDTNGYNEYVKMRSDKKRQKDEIQKMKKDIDEIKSLLMELINGSRQN